MIIKQLLGNLSIQRFLDEHYFKLPLAFAQTAGAFSHLGDWDTLQTLLASPDADLLVAGRQGRWSGDAPRTADDARRLLDTGYTIGVRHAQRLHQPLAELAAGFESDFAAEVDIHFYATPAGQGGFSWHYDAEEVFILQTAGSKVWSLRKNTVNPWPLVETLPEDMRYGAEIMPLSRCELRQGDWLYIPGGYWHRTEAGEESYSLSVGLKPQTGIDILDFARGELLDSLRWRQRLAPVGAVSPSDDASREAYRTHFAELAADFRRLLGDDRFVARFIESQRKPRS